MDLGEAAVGARQREQAGFFPAADLVGEEIPVAEAADVLAVSAAVAGPLVLVLSTTRAAALVATGAPASAALVTANVAELIEGASQTMFTTPFKIAVAFVVTASLVAGAAVARKSSPESGPLADMVVTGVRTMGSCCAWWTGSGIKPARHRNASFGVHVLWGTASRPGFSTVKAACTG
jgi:hypothetical protein